MSSASASASASGSGSDAMDDTELALLWAKLVAQVLSTAMSGVVGVRHLLQALALRKAERMRRQQQTPMLGERRYTAGSTARSSARRRPGQMDATPPPLHLDDSPPPPRNPSCRTTATNSNASAASEARRLQQQQQAAVAGGAYMPVGGPDLSTNEDEDGSRPRVSVASRILRVMCVSDFVFSLSGAVVSAVEIFAPSATDSFQLTFWAQAPHWCSQVASFCWVATLGLYIAKRRGRASFDVAIAHAIIWMLVVFYWVLELYSSYYNSIGFVNAAKIIWKVVAVSCFLTTTFCWLRFARRWRRQERRKGAYVVSKLLSYTVAFFIFVGPIVVTDLAQGLHSVGTILDTTSVILAMWPFVNAVIYLTKPTLCLKLFQTGPGSGRRDTGDAQHPNSLNRAGSRRFMTGGGSGGSANCANGLGGNNGGTDGNGQMLLMSPSHHELKGLEIGEKIGEGVAVVYLGKWRGANVAVKMKAVLAALESAADLAEFQHACNVEIQAEAEVMRGLCHPNIVLFMEAGFYRGSICIISEYCARGSLRDVLKREEPAVKHLSWPTKLRLALGISHGIQYLHNANPPMIHRDLKSPNVLVDASWHAKIADFGTLRFSEIVSSAAQLQTSQTRDSSRKTQTKTPVVEMTGLVGTTRWMAPEVMRGERIYTSKVDIYSLALILWELIEGKLPFESTRWNHEVEDFVLRGVRPAIRADMCPLRWKLLIVTCWQSDPRERPTIQQVINSLQRIGREEVWDPTGPRFTGVSQLGTSLSSSVSHSLTSSSYLDSPPALAATIGGLNAFHPSASTTATTGASGSANANARRQHNRSPAPALDENHASESDSDAESFAEEFAYVPTLDSLPVSPAMMAAPSSASGSSRHGSMDSMGATTTTNPRVSATSSSASMDSRDGQLLDQSHVALSVNLGASAVSTTSSGSGGRTSSQTTTGSVSADSGAMRAAKPKMKRPEWRRRTGTIAETQPADMDGSSPRAFVESSPNGTPFIVNI